jgi:chromate transporter
MPALTTSTTPTPRLSALFLLFLRVGGTAFGMGMLQSLRETLLRHKLVTEQELAEGLALVQLYPGPMMADLAAYIGYLRRGVPGALVSLLGFIAPSTLMMLVLAILYHHFGARPSVAQGLIGLDAVMAGVLLHVALDFGRRQLRSRQEWLLAGLAGTLAIAGADLSLLILVGITLGAWLKRKAAAHTEPTETLQIARFKPAILMTSGLLLGIAVALWWPSRGSDLYLGFLHIGAVAFGNGVTILPMLRDVVLDHGWLTPSQLSTAIAFGQITPGPILNAATFAGYMVAGWPGGLLATFAIFAPSFVMTLVFAELFTRIRHLAWIKGAIHGAMIVFCGMVASVTWFMAAHGVRKLSDGLVVIAVWAALSRFKLSLPLSMLGGVLLWLLLGLVS